VSEVAKRLRDRRLNVWTDARAILDRGAEENRELTPEEEGSWKRMMEELDKIDHQLDGVLSAEKRQAATDAAFDAIGKKPIAAEYRRGGDSGPVYPADSSGRNLNDEIRAVLNGSGARAIEIHHQNGRFGQEEFRTLLNSGTPTAVIPTDFYDRLVAHLIEVSGIMQAGPTVLNTAGGETLQIPKTTTHSTAAITGTGAQIPTADPAFSQATLAAYKYGVMLQVARELLDDTAVDLLGYLAMQAGRAVGNAFGSDLILGNGAGAKPAGLIFATSASPGVTGPVSTAIPTASWNVTGAPTYGNLVDLEYSVIAPYRQSRSCYWLARDATVGGLRKITDLQGRPVWEPSTVLGSPDLLLGKPLVADPFMPAVGANGFSIAFGDFAQFFVRLVGGVRFERSDDYAFGSDLVTFRCLIRGDGVLVDTNGVKVFKGGAT
jgi:HK97 family phage major capsid protein